jgi:hypothetical protein
MLDDDPERHPSYRRPARNSRFLIGLIIVGAIVVLLQYTSYAIFSAERTSMLWGMLTGLVIGGFIFGWLKLR